MNRKILEKKLENLQHGNVLRYHIKGHADDNYLVVAGVRDGRVYGHIVSPIGVNSISIDDILKAENLSLAEFNEV